MRRTSGMWAEKQHKASPTSMELCSSFRFRLAISIGKSEAHAGAQNESTDCTESGG